MSIYNDYALGMIETLQFDFNENQILKAGVNLRHDVHKEQGAYGGPITQMDSDLTSSLFAEYAHRLPSIFRFVVSGSYDRNDLITNGKDQNYTLGGRCYSFYTQGDLTSLQGWTLQGIVYADLSDYVQLHANIGRRARIPSPNTRTGSQFGTRVQNTSLRTETAMLAQTARSWKTRNMGILMGLSFITIKAC